MTAGGGGMPPDPDCEAAKVDQLLQLLATSSLESSSGGPGSLDAAAIAAAISESSLAASGSGISAVSGSSSSTSSSTPHLQHPASSSSSLPPSPVSAAWLAMGVWAKDVGKESVRIVAKGLSIRRSGNAGSRSVTSAPSPLAAAGKCVRSSSESSSFQTAPVRTASANSDLFPDGGDFAVMNPLLGDADTGDKDVDHILDDEPVSPTASPTLSSFPPSPKPIPRAQLSAVDATPSPIPATTSASHHLFAASSATHSTVATARHLRSRRPSPAGILHLPNEILSGILSHLPTRAILPLLRTPAPLSTASSTELSTRLYSIRTLEDLKGFVRCSHALADGNVPCRGCMDRSKPSVGPLFYRAGTIVMFARYFMRLVPEAKALLGVGYAVVLAWFMCVFYAVPFFGALVLYSAMDLVDAISQFLNIGFSQIPSRIRRLILSKTHPFHPDAVASSSAASVPACLVRRLRFEGPKPILSPSDPPRCCGPAGSMTMRAAALAGGGVAGGPPPAQGFAPNDGVNEFGAGVLGPFAEGDFVGVPNAGAPVPDGAPATVEDEEEDLLGEPIARPALAAGTAVPDSDSGPNATSAKNKNWGLMSPYTPWHLYLLTYAVSSHTRVIAPAASHAAPKDVYDSDNEDDPDMPATTPSFGRFAVSWMGLRRRRGAAAPTSSSSGRTSPRPPYSSSSSFVPLPAGATRPPTYPELMAAFDAFSASVAASATTPMASAATKVTMRLATPIVSVLSFVVSVVALHVAWACWWIGGGVGWAAAPIVKRWRRRRSDPAVDDGGPKEGTEDETTPCSHPDHAYEDADADAATDPQHKDDAAADPHHHLLTATVTGGVTRLTLSRVSLAWWFRLHPVPSLRALALERCEVDENGVSIVAAACQGVVGLVLRRCEVRGGGGWKAREAAALGQAEPAPLVAAAAAANNAGAPAAPNTAAAVPPPPAAAPAVAPNPNAAPHPVPQSFNLTNMKHLAGVGLFPRLRLVRFELCGSASCGVDAVRMVLDRSPCVERVEFVGCGPAEEALLEAIGCVEIECVGGGPAAEDPEDAATGVDEEWAAGAAARGRDPVHWFECAGDAEACVDDRIRRGGVVLAPKLPALATPSETGLDVDGAADSVGVGLPPVMTVAGPAASYPPAPRGYRKCHVVQGPAVSSKNFVSQQTEQQQQTTTMAERRGLLVSTIKQIQHLTALHQARAAPPSLAAACKHLKFDLRDTPAWLDATDDVDDGSPKAMLNDAIQLCNDLNATSLFLDLSVRDDGEDDGDYDVEEGMGSSTSVSRLLNNPPTTVRDLTLFLDDFEAAGNSLGPNPAVQWTHLRSLTLNADRDSDSDHTFRKAWRNLLARFPNLQYLTVTFNPSDSCLEDPANLRTLAELCPRLRAVYSGAAASAPETSPQDIDAFFTALPDLRVVGFELYDLAPWTAASVADAPWWRRIVGFALQPFDDAELDPEGVETMVARLGPTVRALTLDGGARLMGLLQLVARTCLTLECLTLGGASDDDAETRTAVRWLIANAPPRLRRLLWGTGAVSEEDAEGRREVEELARLANEKGIEFVPRIRGPGSAEEDEDGLVEGYGVGEVPREIQYEEVEMH
ncbi:hypothetical protein HDU96_002556 [Phlyctochytrium bullatum]|nr:hypothetical protein HDU96_002556 [Phlyctochytrium bullatum]